MGEGPRNEDALAEKPHEDGFIADEQHQHQHQHDVEQEYGGKNVTWKDYYGLRNELIMFKRHYPKRTFVIKVIKKLIRTTGMYLKKDTRIRATLFYAAIRDGVAGRMGVHPVYRPGWKAPEK